MRPDDCILAQGPLEANVNGLTLAVGSTGACALADPLSLPTTYSSRPAGGQLALFERASLTPSQYDVWEAAWPALERLSAAVVRRPRELALSLARLASRDFGGLMPASVLWGNRYFFAGRVPAGP